MADERLPGKKLQVRVLTPKGPAVVSESESVIAPGTLGQLEVLPGHIPLLTGIAPGVLTLGGSGERHVLAVASGYMRVSGADDIEILIEQAIPGADVDIAAAESDLADAEADLKAWKDGITADYKTLQVRHAFAKARVDAHAAA
ncbi:MAG TPA: ATP synthase F1 subunit epsilon [Kofleriaceae bacterium]|nr:ATP synthase F1 subunit epsilon [Kofleriaceae bacterium]